MESERREGEREKEGGKEGERERERGRKREEEMEGEGGREGITHVRACGIMHHYRPVSSPSYKLPCMFIHLAATVLHRCVAYPESTFVF